jgi:hypothetical protein
MAGWMDEWMDAKQRWKGEALASFYTWPVGRRFIYSCNCIETSPSGRGEGGKPVYIYGLHRQRRDQRF